MLKIKLSPTGKKHQRQYQVVVMEENSKLTGTKIDVLGHFHPLIPKNNPQRFLIDKEKLSGWIKSGAQPTPKIRSLAKI